MFYRPEDGHGLPRNPFNAIITPRPIGWISTRSGAGLSNLAPYSFFNGVAYAPPQVMFASTGTKDSITNIRETGTFCVNVVEFSMRDAMNVSSETVPPETDEFAHAGVEQAECETIDCPRIKGAPASLECRLTQEVQINGADNHVVFGEVTGIHLRDDCLKDGFFDVTAYHPLTRLGYRDYSVVREVFSLQRPDD